MLIDSIFVAYMKYVSSSHDTSLRTMCSHNGGSRINPCCCFLLLSCSSFSTPTNQHKGHVRYPYPAIGEKAYGRWASVTVTVCINITLIGKRVIFQYNLNRRKRRIILHRHATCFSRSLYV